MRSRWREINCDSNSSRKPRASSALPSRIASCGAGFASGVPAHAFTNSLKLTSQTSARLTPFMRAGIGVGMVANMHMDSMDAPPACTPRAVDGKHEGWSTPMRGPPGQNALMPVSSRPITSWCTVSVPS